MTKETESFLTQSSSSLPPPQPQNLVDPLSSNDSSTQGLLNEGMNNNGSQIPSSDDFCSCIVFNITQLKNILLSCFNPAGPDNIAREAKEELIKPQATTYSNAQPQHPGSDFDDAWSSNQDDQIIDGYMISRNPFDPIGRPFNPFGPIQRPLPRLPSTHDLADLGFV